ncbi:immunity 49 family protein [Streptomyces sp. 150FB]|uniref:immunity 49 family protein n=1 Tax=Streptomyces sp. 150FB TaxID=1576605 RepID=UPI000A852A02|nr:immunity 49 family protein [Streptomyces sp. 150FB]
MVSAILRHSFPAENAEAGLALLQENAQELIDGLEERSTRLGDAMGTTLTLAKAHCLMDPRGSIFPTWDAWVNAMQVGTAVFAAATTAEDHVQCRIAHKDRILQATGPQWYVHPNAWLTAFYLAVVCRERDKITALCRVPLSLLRENGSRYDEFFYAWIDTLHEAGHRAVPADHHRRDAASAGAAGDRCLGQDMGERGRCRGAQVGLGRRR